MMLLKQEDRRPTIARTTSSSSSTTTGSQQLSQMRSTTKPSRNQAAMRIRSRYLHRLGVADSSFCSISSSASCDSFSTADTTGSPKRKHVRRRSRPDEIEFQPLKEDSCDNEQPSPRSQDSNQKPIHHKVSFENFVVVHRIPNLDAYSEDMKNAIWTSSEAMEAEVMRNCIEFASEGMNWQDTLEEDMFLEYNNELIHPVHIMNRHCSLQQNFLMGMRARQTCQ